MRPSGSCPTTSTEGEHVASWMGRHGPRSLRTTDRGAVAFPQALAHPGPAVVVCDSEQLVVWDLGA